MKKRFLAIALLALCGTVLSGCGEDNTNPTPTPGPTPGPITDGEGFIDTPTTIYLWTTAGTDSQNVLNRWVEEFKEVEPNVTVVNVKQSGSYDELENMIRTGFTGNNYPDIAYAYPDNVANYIDFGKAVKLDSYIDNPDYGWTAEEKADFIPAYLQEGQQYTVEGTWSLPFSKSTEAMFYNEDVLIGLDLSKIDATINDGDPLNAQYLNNLTWEELFGKLAPAILKYDAEVRNIIEPCDDTKTRVLGYDSDDNLFITLARQYGLPYTSVQNGEGSIDFNTPEMKELLKDFNGYYQAGYFTTKGANEGNYVNELFTKNQLLFSIGSTGGTTYQFSEDNPMNIGVARIPQHEGGTASTIMQGPSMVILDHNDENRRLASWLFYKYMTKAENTLEWGTSSTGYFPIRQSNLTDPEYIELSDVESKQEQSLDRLLASVNNYFPTMEDTLFTSPAFKGSSQARTAVGGAFTQALLATGDDAAIDAAIQKALNEAESSANLAL